MNQLSNSAFLRITDVLQLIPIGKSTWWAGVKEGRFPKPVKIGPRAGKTNQIQHKFYSDFSIHTTNSASEVVI